MRERDTIEDLIANATSLDLAKALQEVFRASPRTIADSELLGHLSAWIHQMEQANAQA